MGRYDDVTAICRSGRERGRLICSYHTFRYVLHAELHRHPWSPEWGTRAIALSNGCQLSIEKKKKKWGYSRKLQPPAPSHRTGKPSEAWRIFALDHQLRGWKDCLKTATDFLQKKWNFSMLNVMVWFSMSIKAGWTRRESAPRTFHPLVPPLTDMHLTSWHPSTTPFTSIGRGKSLSTTVSWSKTRARA